MEAAEQPPIGAHTVSLDISVTPIILGPGDAEPVAQAVELLGVDRVDGNAAIDQRVDNRSMRYFDTHSNNTRRPGNRQQPVAQLRQTRAAVRKRAFTDNVALSIENTRLVAGS